MMEYFYKSFIDDASVQLNNILQQICIRTLIAIMHSYKQNGRLTGSNSKEEYNFFNKEITSKNIFVQRTFEEFPILSEIISKKIKYAVEYYTQIIAYFVSDKNQIEKLLGHKVSKITKIKVMTSDVHNHGKQVMRIQLDLKDEILYKPHSMENEKIFNELLKWFKEKTGLDYRRYAFISCEDHSWSTILEYSACETEEQLENYYRRFGLQLFLAYVFGTKDLHYENIIASGEYPVLIDLETLVNLRLNETRKTVNEEIRYELFQSVLYTGLLPIYLWNNTGNGVNLSGVCGDGNQRYPFKIPCILEPETSNMRIGYNYPVSKKAMNQATLNGKFICPNAYKEKIIEGFKVAYNCVIDLKIEFMSILHNIENLTNRYVLLDSQRYAMMLSASYHPSLLMDKETRKQFWKYQWEGRNEINKEIVESEIISLDNGDIPYFYYYLNQTSLFDSGGKEIKNYFKDKPYKLVIQNVNGLSLKDLNRQIEFIQISLELSGYSGKKYVNNVYKVNANEVKRIDDLKIIKSHIEILKERILDYDVWNQNHTEVNWYLTRISSNNGYSWHIQPADMCLYDGLAGIFLIIYGLLSYKKDDRVEKVFKAIEKQIFQYTDDSLKYLKCLKGRNTGAFTGESSIVYTYLCLFRMTKEYKYLEYAEKHVLIVDSLLKHDSKYDLLSGNAGAIVVLCLLYSITEKNNYLEMAIRAAEILKNSAKKQEIGIGWIVDQNTSPMTGMAHGNSGILMAMITLWKCSGKEEYLEISKEILKYEDALYDPEMNNWKDVRLKKHSIETDNMQGSIAWCHGSGGILLSRMKCLGMIDDPWWREVLSKDIEYSYTKLKSCWKRDSWSLCHGIVGNLMILGKYEKKDYWCNDTVRFLPHEILNPGMMNGYGGVLYSLLQLQGTNLPDILSLD